jgi:hypothetical protein
MSRFALSRSALLPVCPGIAQATLQRALEDGGPALESLIIRHHLAPLWHKTMRAAAFADLRRNAAVGYMKQRAALDEIDTLFEREGLHYAVIKGAATRELTYDDPALRTCGDIDVLVAPDQRVAAARALTSLGYRLQVHPSVVSHEVALTKRMVDIDLHWDILRPGRTPDGFARAMLARRIRHGGWWMLSDPDAVLLMLVHAAVSKHVSTPVLGLHRAADLALFWQRRDVDWPAVHRLLDACGLKTAAWAVLTWLLLMTGPEMERQLAGAVASVRPGFLRTEYLKVWLDHDLPARLTDRHAARLIGFSLFMHDGPSSAWRALAGWRRAQKALGADVQAFEELTPT